LIEKEEEEESKGGKRGEEKREVKVISDNTKWGYYQEKVVVKDFISDNRGL
jgi:hypothetical protein